MREAGPCVRRSHPAKKVLEPLVNTLEHTAHQTDVQRAVGWVVTPDQGQAVVLIVKANAATGLLVAFDAFLKGRVVELPTEFQGVVQAFMGASAQRCRLPKGVVKDPLHVFHCNSINSSSHLAVSTYVYKSLLIPRP